MFQHKKFSQDLKTFKAQYLNQEPVDQAIIQQYLTDLAAVDLSQFQTDSAKIAFWVNVYNGLTNYWVIKKGIKKSMLEKPFLVMFSKVVIGGHRFSLDDIEHGVLRKNRRSLYKLCKQFSKRDTRRAFMVEQLDYRIHFALNCGAKSCPAIAFYDEKHLEQQLQMAEESFVEQDFLVNETEKTIACSKIFWLYKKDFVQIYVNAPQYKDYKVSHLKYDFSVH
jgi:hypothetical protein